MLHVRYADSKCAINFIMLFRKSNRINHKHEEIEEEMLKNKNWPEITTEPLPVERSPKAPRPTTTVTLVTPQPVRKLSIIGIAYILLFLKCGNQPSQYP